MPKRTNLFGRSRRYKKLPGFFFPLTIARSFVKKVKASRRRTSILGQRPNIATQEKRKATWTKRVKKEATRIAKRKASGELKRMARTKRFGGGRLRPFYGNQHVRIAAGGTTARRNKKVGRRN